MSIVKPPTLNELIKTYGSGKAAVLHLLKSGFTPEQIEWKFRLPYYLVRLYMEGFEPRRKTFFSEIVRLYDRLALLRSKKGKETELTNFFQRKDLSLEFKVRLTLGKLVDESLKIGPGTIERALSIATGKSLQEVRRLLIDYGEHGEVAYLLKKPKQGELTVEEVYEAIQLLPNLKKIHERERIVASLLRKANRDEAKYIVRLLLGDLKLGVKQSTVIRAVSRAYGVPVELIESACAVLGITDGLMLAPKGIDALSAVKLRPGQFIKPQLAHLYEPDKVVFPVRAEYKVDGSRLQIHKWGTKIWLFSRRGIEKSKTLPEIVEIASKFKAQSCMIDSEVVAIDKDGNFLPFQFLLERTVPRELKPEELEERKRRVGVTIKVFDTLYLNGQVLTDLPLRERIKYLEEVVPKEYLMEGRTCRNEVELISFYDEALKKGFEGLVVKNLEAKYEIGKRTYTWLKLKPERDTLDCTIVKALYGKGKRAGVYSSFLLAVRDSKQRKLYTVGRVSNLSEEAMETLTQIIERTKINENKDGVYVKPSIVVEVTFQEIQQTDEYTSGFALRVPKVVRFRPDKSVEEIDTIEKLTKLYELQYERYPVKEIG